jgi:glycosyltransferase involved in cell wall biosynthesis
MRIGIMSTCLGEGASGAERVATNLASALYPTHEIALISIDGLNLVATDMGGAVISKTALRGQSLAGRMSENVAKKLVWHVRDTYRLGAAKALVQIARDLNLQLVNTHTLTGVSASCWRALESAGIPSVHVLHDYSLLCVRGSMFKNGETCETVCAECSAESFVSRYVVGHPTAYVSPSAYSARRHETALRLTPGSVVVIPNASEAPRWRRRLSTEATNLLFVGKLDAHKGAKVLLDAVQATSPLPVRVTFVGSGSLSETIRTLASSDDRIRLRAPQSISQLHDEYLAAKWLLIPSVWPENAPMVALEGMATGLPLAVSPVGGLPEMAEATGAAIVSSGCTSEDWRNTLEYLTTDRADVELLSESARVFSGSWTTKAMADRYLELFQRVLSEGLECPI